MRQDKLGHPLITFYLSAVGIAAFAMGLAVHLVPSAVQSRRDVVPFLICCLVPPIGLTLGGGVVVMEIWDVVRPRVKA